MKAFDLAVIVVVLTTFPFFGQTNQLSEAASSTNVIAVVLGKNISAKDGKNLNGLIFKPLLDQYAIENKIAPTVEELDAFTRKTEESTKQNLIKREQDREKLLTDLKSTSLNEKEQKQKQAQLAVIERILKADREATPEMEEQLRPMKRQMAEQFVRAWMINKSLYAKYGGRVIFQQAGVEPLDAYREFLKDQETKGAFQILDKKYEAPFWNYFTNDTMHIFYKGEEKEKFINTPWWLMETPPGK